MSRDGERRKKGKKRGRKNEGGDGKEVRGRGGYKDKYQRYDEDQRGGAGAAERVQLVSDDMQQYVGELAEQLNSEEIDEDSKEILVNNALEEFIGKEAQLCKDPVCSRAIETLVNLFTTSQLTNFIGSLSQGDEERLTGVFIDPFASHVVERLFDRIRSILKESTGDVSSELLEALGELCKPLHSARLLNIATHKYGSHVMRSLFVLLSGVEYPTTRSNKGWNKIFSFSIEKAQTFAKYRTNKKLVHLKDKLAQNYLDLYSEDVVHMAYDQYGSPVLQTFLQCTIGEDFGSQMIFKILEDRTGQGQEQGGSGGAQPVSNLSPNVFKNLATHNLASHLIESVFISAEESIRSALYEKCVKGQLKEYALHPFANFVIQALITCLTNKNVAKDLVEELLPLFDQLLQCSKGGVVAATLNMCSRLNVKTSKAFKAIELILHGKLERQGVEIDKSSSTLVLALMALDKNTPAHHQSSDSIFVSKVGGTILCTLLKFPPDKCKHLFRSMKHLKASEILQMTEDYLGIRILEAFLESPADSDLKQPLIRSIKGHFGSIATVTHCSFFLEKCFKAAHTDAKEMIVEDMLKAKNEILQTYRGPGLFKTCAVELYKRSRREWTQHLAKMESVQKSYEEMFR